MVKCDQKRTSCAISLTDVHLHGPSQCLLTESDEVELQADEQHSTSRGGGRVRSGRLTSEGTRWLEGMFLELGASLWRASHSTSHLRTKSDLSS